MTIYLRAYKAYHQQDYDQCLKILKEIKQDDIRKLDLLAQTYFQKRDFQKAYDIYRELIDTKPDEYSEQRRDNILTIIACAQLENPGKLKTKPEDKLPQPGDIVDQVQQISLKDETVLNIFAGKYKRSGKEATKQRKKRKTKLPKSYNPNVTPDPERWLPLRDRKGPAHRQKQKRRQRPNPKGKGRGK